MFSVKGDATIAAVSELKQSYTKLLDRVDRGESVVLQRNNEAVGVLLSYPMYQELMCRVGLVENLVLAITALRREERVLQNKDHLIPMDEMLREFGIDPDSEDGGTDEV